jgi:hypothetical protein
VGPRSGVAPLPAIAKSWGFGGAFPVAARRRRSGRTVWFAAAAHRTKVEGVRRLETGLRSGGQRRGIKFPSHATVGGKEDPLYVACCPL